MWLKDIGRKTPGVITNARWSLFLFFFFSWFKRSAVSSWQCLCQRGANFPYWWQLPPGVAKSRSLQCGGILFPLQKSWTLNPTDNEKIIYTHCRIQLRFYTKPTGLGKQTVVCSVVVFLLAYTVDPVTGGLESNHSMTGQLEHHLYLNYSCCSEWKTII